MEKREYMVWTGSSYMTSWATSAAKAINNCAWRCRKMGKFPIRSQFEATPVKGETHGQA